MEFPPVRRGRWVDASPVDGSRVDGSRVVGYRVVGAPFPEEETEGERCGFDWRVGGRVQREHPRERDGARGFGGRRSPAREPGTQPGSHAPRFLHRGWRVALRRDARVRRRGDVPFPRVRRRRDARIALRKGSRRGGGVGVSLGPGRPSAREGDARPRRRHHPDTHRRHHPDTHTHRARASLDAHRNRDGFGTLRREAQARRRAKRRGGVDLRGCPPSVLRRRVSSDSTTPRALSLDRRPRGRRPDRRGGWFSPGGARGSSTRLAVCPRRGGAGGAGRGCGRAGRLGTSLGERGRRRGGRRGGRGRHAAGETQGLFHVRRARGGGVVPHGERVRGEKPSRGNRGRRTEREKRTRRKVAMKVF